MVIAPRVLFQKSGSFLNARAEERDVPAGAYFSPVAMRVKGATCLHQARMGAERGHGGRSERERLPGSRHGRGYAVALFTARPDFGQACNIILA